MLDGSARLKGRAPTVEVSAHVPTCRPPFGGGSFRFHVSLLNGTLRRGPNTVGHVDGPLARGLHLAASEEEPR